ncbi:MAG: aminopeptidase [Gammaproteobacteria bacterium]|nr:aminopeptidase [Gammaproteobacteria bacterium]
MVRAIILALAVTANGGCSTVHFYGQAVLGHARVLAGSRDIDTLIARGKVEPTVAERLALVGELCRFAVDELLLPDNDSYTRYTDLDREHVLWNVFAAPEFSVSPHTWCYPVAGCVAYRGYFSESSARRYAERLAREGHDVFVGGVDAYSTLGRLSDPVLSTFIDYGEAETAALIFHELAHQRLYVPGDTVFNESFATAVEEVGVERWLELRGAPEELARYRRSRGFSDAVTAMMLDHRERLAALYARPLDAGVMRAAKREQLDRLHEDYLALLDARNVEPSRGAIDRSAMNNAIVASFDVYHRFTPAFARILEREGGSLAALYRFSQELAEMPPERRHEALTRLTGKEGTP